MALDLRLQRDKAGKNTFGLEFSDLKFNTTLLNGVEQTLTVPGPESKYLMIFSIQPGSQVWIAKNATAAIPGAAFAQTDSELNPVARNVKGGDVIHFITNNTDATVGVILYAI